MKSVRIYWAGNAAKAEIIADILKRSETGPARKILIFDYGCGTGGDWGTVLAEYPNLILIGYDPSPERIQAAQERLSGTTARFYSGAKPPRLEAEADYIVSFSVFEHVLDRRGYPLCQCK